MRTSCLILTLALLAAACSSHRAEKPRTGTLEERVGNEGGIEKIVDAFATNLAGDDRLAPRFASVDMARFRSAMTAHLCKAVGAACGGAGTASDAVGGMTLTEDEFGAFMEVFILSMNDAELPQQEQNDLIDQMLATQDQLVAK